VIQYVIRRVLWSIPVLFMLTLAVFLLLRAIPGGPFEFAGDKKLPASVRANLERRFHLDEPLSVQFVRYLVGDFVDTRDIRDFGKDGLLRGDLGPSLRQRGRSVNDILGDSFPISAQLGILSIMLAIIIGIPAGIFAALKRNTWIDYVSTFVAVLGVSIPNMVMGPLLIWLFALELNWFPVATWGAKPPFFLGFLPTPTAKFWSHAILPTLALGTALSASIARLTRASPSCQPICHLRRQWGSREGCARGRE